MATWNGLLGLNGVTAPRVVTEDFLIGEDSAKIPSTNKSQRQVIVQPKIALVPIGNIGSATRRSVPFLNQITENSNAKNTTDELLQGEVTHGNHLLTLAENAPFHVVQRDIVFMHGL